MGYTLDEIIKLVHEAKYEHKKTIWLDDENYNQYNTKPYIVYTKPLYNLVGHAVVVSTNGIVLLKEYLAPNAAGEEIMLDNMVEKYHTLYTKASNARNNLFYRTVLSAGGIAIGVFGLPMIPLIDEMLLGVSGYLIGKVLDEHDPKCRQWALNDLNDYLEYEEILSGREAVAVLCKEAGKS